MTKTTRRLTLPGGGSVDIQLDDVVESAPLAGADLPGRSTPWFTIAAGALVGGLATWLIVRWTRA